jgi:hypothetical protein
MNCRRIIHIASFYAIQKCTCQTLQQQQLNLLVLKNYDAPAGNQTQSLYRGFDVLAKH